MASSLEAKIVVLGSQGVGKTSLVQRYVKNQFLPTTTTSTIGASFLTKKILDTDSDTLIRLQIWDTAGQERFRSISRLYYRGANACILCYSITDKESFEEMGVWLQELRKNLPADVILHVVGTKADMVAGGGAEREVPFERCIAYVAENLAPGSTTELEPPPTPSGLRQYLSGPPTANTADGARSPSSKRSSGFWGQEVGWDCCHEVSAESGEGVEEVFRVITRKLVAQNRKMAESLQSAVGTPGFTPGLEGGDAGGYFDHMRPVGSFRVGRDRRSWLGFPVDVLAAGGGEETEEIPGRAQTKGKRCC